ncbi:LysR family transcriptional regulator substrate-binding protein [Lysinibacillus antri]|uniref:LysR family transcriptional regulator substrate-binding protein n=1 Tax=Lysinibacillus antri TaxID=2498145 RepID=UPI0034E07453
MYSTFENTLKSFNLHNVTPETIIECKDITMVVSLVSRGVGISIIPRMNYEIPAPEHITVYELNKIKISVQPVLISRRETTMSSGTRNLWNLF